MKKCDIRFKVENDLTTIGAVDESNNIQDITAVTEYKNQFDKEARFFYNYKKLTLSYGKERAIPGLLSFTQQCKVHTLNLSKLMLILSFYFHSIEIFKFQIYSIKVFLSTSVIVF